MTAPLSGGAGIGVQLLSAAASSGTASRRVVLDSPVSNFGLVVTHTASSLGVEVILSGTPDNNSTGSTGIALMTRTTGQTSGLVEFSTSTPRPVMQLWCDISKAQTTSGASSTGSINVWVSAI